MYVSFDYSTDFSASNMSTCFSLWNTNLPKMRVIIPMIPNGIAKEIQLRAGLNMISAGGTIFRM